MIPCTPSDPGAQPMTLMTIPETEQSYVMPMPLQTADFIRVLQSAKPSVGREDLTRQVEWTREFGQEGA